MFLVPVPAQPFYDVAHLSSVLDSVYSLSMGSLLGDFLCILSPRINGTGRGSTVTLVVASI